MILLLCAVILIVICAKSPASGGNGGERTMRCPSCGAQATVRGNSWECGWCGDSGVFR